MRKRLVLLILIISSTIGIVYYPSQFYIKNLTQVNIKFTDTILQKTTDLTLITNTINIINDDNFTDYGFEGLGSETLPYLIQNLNISTNNDNGIFIKDTTKFRKRQGNIHY